MPRAERWQWERRSEARAALGRKARTLATDWGEPLLGLAQLPAVFFPWAKDGLDKLERLVARHTADLDISTLDGPASLAPIEGVPPPVAAKSGEGPVFFTGVEATLTLAHNGRGEQQILLEWIELRLDGFVPGNDPYFSFHREGEEIIGAGFVEPMRFFIELGAAGPMPARRQVRGEDGKRTMLVASGPNALNTEPGGWYSFSPGEAPQILKFTLSAVDAGYYETRLHLLYRVGRDLREYASEPIRLYADGG